MKPTGVGGVVPVPFRRARGPQPGNHQARPLMPARTIPIGLPSDLSVQAPLGRCFGALDGHG